MEFRFIKIQILVDDDGKKMKLKFFVFHSFLLKNLSFV